MAVGNRHGDKEESIVQSLLVLFCSQTTLRTLLNKSHTENSGQDGADGESEAWPHEDHARSWRREVFLGGDMMANCTHKDLKSFHSKEGLPQLMTQMDKVGTAADLAQHKSTVVFILRWERERPHFKHRLVNHLTGD